MAKRTVDTELWNNEDIIENFTAEDRYFWLYLLTNPHNNICGVVKNSPALMGRDMGYDKDAIVNLIYRFEKVHGLIFTDKQTNEILILNWYKYNWTKSPKIISIIEKEQEQIKSKAILELIEQRKKLILGYPIDTLSVGYGYPPNTNTDSNSNYINNYDILDYKKLLKIVKEECYSVYLRHSKQVDEKGNLQLVRQVTALLEDLQGQYTYEQLREIFRHANKTYIVSPQYSTLDIAWVLKNINKVMQTEETDTPRVEENVAENSKGHWDEMLENIGRIDKKGN